MDSKLPGDALRLNMALAVERVGSISFLETGSEHAGEHVSSPGALIDGAGDIVLSRKGSGLISYFFASAIDDDFQNITEVVRGIDLFQFTPVQVLLLKLLDLEVPSYHHHRLIRDEAGKRLAKRDNARSIRKYREDGWEPNEVRKLVGL